MNDNTLTATDISRQCQYDGHDIFHLMIDALIDSNFHNEALELIRTWDMITNPNRDRR